MQTTDDISQTRSTPIFFPHQEMWINIDQLLVLAAARLQDTSEPLLREEEKPLMSVQYHMTG